MRFGHTYVLIRNGKIYFCLFFPEIGFSSRQERIGLLDLYAPPSVKSSLQQVTLWPKEVYLLIKKLSLPTFILIVQMF